MTTRIPDERYSNKIPEYLWPEDHWAYNMYPWNWSNGLIQYHVLNLDLSVVMYKHHNGNRYRKHLKDGKCTVCVIGTFVLTKSVVRLNRKHIPFEELTDSIIHQNSISHIQLIILPWERLRPLHSFWP